MDDHDFLEIYFYLKFRIVGRGKERPRKSFYSLVHSPNGPHLGRLQTRHSLRVSHIDAGPRYGSHPPLLCPGFSQGSDSEWSSWDTKQHIRGIPMLQAEASPAKVDHWPRDSHVKMLHIRHKANHFQ